MTTYLCGEETLWLFGGLIVVTVLLVVTINLLNKAERRALKDQATLQGYRRALEDAGIDVDVNLEGD